MNKKWWQQSVVYQIYPRSFMDTNNDGIGDIRGIISKLDYLANLGIDVIWLSPVYQSPMCDNGYDISDYQAIAPEFGTMEDMDCLIEEAKKRNIKIIMDLVVNHTSIEHEWFKEARSSLDNPYRDYYIWREPTVDGHPPSDMGSVFGGSAWTLDPITNQYYLHLFDKGQPDLNWENPKVREEVHQMMNWWLDKGIGGFRMDVIDLVGKVIDQGITGNGPKLHDYLQDMHKATFGPYDVLTVGETWGATPEIAKLYSDPDRYELNMVFQFEHITMDHDERHGKWMPKKQNPIKLKQVLSKWQTELGNEGWNSLFWNNHDLPRIVSKYGDEGEHRVVSAKMLATLLHFMKGTPYIYQGEEIGMTNVKFEDINDYDDVEIHNFYKDYEPTLFSKEEKMEAIWSNGRDNSRTPVQWSDDKNAGFTQARPWMKVNPNYSSINVLAALEASDSIFYHYKKLIQLRKDYDTIVYGDFKLILPDDPNTFCYMREDDDHRFVVINNLTNQAVSLSLPEEISLSGELTISNYADVVPSNTMILRPYESFVIHQ